MKLSNTEKFLYFRLIWGHFDALLLGKTAFSLQRAHLIPRLLVVERFYYSNELNVSTSSQN